MQKECTAYRKKGQSLRAVSAPFTIKEIVMYLRRKGSNSSLLFRKQWSKRFLRHLPSSSFYYFYCLTPALILGQRGLKLTKEERILSILGIIAVAILVLMVMTSVTEIP